MNLKKLIKANGGPWTDLYHTMGLLDQQNSLRALLNMQRVILKKVALRDDVGVVLWDFL